MRARHHLLIWALQNTKGQMFSHWDRMTALQTSLWRQSPPPLLPGPHPWPVWVIICRGIFDGKTDITQPFLCQRSKLAAWGPHSTNQALKWSGLSGGVLTSFLIGASKYLETACLPCLPLLAVGLHLLLSLIYVPCGPVKAFEFAAFIFRSTLGFSPTE